MNTAQGSIVLRKIRTGNTLSITLSANAMLVQFANKIGDEVIITPNWGVAANQPIITPIVAVSGGAIVRLSDHAWYYNGTLIADSDDRFDMMINGSIKIIKNLASASNLFTDTLMYRGMANVANVMTSIEKSIDIEIRQVGVTESYGEIFSRQGNTLSAELSQLTLDTMLMQGDGMVSNYIAKWYKDSDYLTGKDGKSLVVNRSDVNGTQLYIAAFYIGEKEVDRGSFVAIDNTDEIDIVLSPSHGTTVPDHVSESTVTASVRVNGVVSNPPGATWATQKRHSDDLSLISEVESNVITVHDDDYINNGKDCEVVVTSEVEF